MNTAWKKIALLAMCASFVLTGFFACSKNAASSDTIKIGGIFPLSGEVAVYGIECKNGIELAISEINAAGGVNGKKLVLISEDDEGNQEKTVNAYQKLISSDGVKFVIGSLTSGCTGAITNLAQANKIVLIAPAATSASITQPGNFIFRACFTDQFQGGAGGEFAATDLNAKRAAVFYNAGNDYSVGLTDNFAQAFTSHGGTIVASESYAAGEKDFNAQLTKIKSANPDVVYLPDYYTVVSLIVKQLRAQGINTPIVGGDGWDGIIPSVGGEILNGFYSNHYSADDTDNAAVAKFVDSYRNTYGSTPVSFAALGYDSLYLLKDAIVNAGAGNENDSEAVRAALEKTNGVYVTGNLTFDENRNPLKPAVMLEIINDDGELKPVYKTKVNP